MRKRRKSAEAFQSDPSKKHPLAYSLSLAQDGSHGSRHVGGNLFRPRRFPSFLGESQSATEKITGKRKPPQPTPVFASNQMNHSSVG